MIFLAFQLSITLHTHFHTPHTPLHHTHTPPHISHTSTPLTQVVDLLPSRGKQGWTKLECLKVEKGLLTFGWANWKRIIRNTSFSKRQLGSKDIENIARTIVREGSLWGVFSRLNNSY